MSSFVENLSIRTKLVAGFGLALTVIVGVGVLGMFQLKALNDTAVQITEVMMPRVVQLDDIKRMIAEHQLLATRRASTPRIQASSPS